MVCRPLRSTDSRSCVARVCCKKKRVTAGWYLLTVKWGILHGLFDATLGCPGEGWVLRWLVLILLRIIGLILMLFSVVIFFETLCFCGLLAALLRLAVIYRLHLLDLLTPSMLLIDLPAIFLGVGSGLLPCTCCYVGPLCCLFAGVLVNPRRLIFWLMKNLRWTAARDECAIDGPLRVLFTVAGAVRQ